MAFNQFQQLNIVNKRKHKLLLFPDSRTQCKVMTCMMSSPKRHERPASMELASLSQQQRVALLFRHVETPTFAQQNSGNLLLVVSSVKG
jgi:hypothetical protein